MRARTHFIGIGGIGMSALAQILLARGEQVSGSDTQASNLTEKLAALGAQISIGHAAAYVEGASLVVVSDAIHDDNVELRRARELGLKTVRRSKMLAKLMAEKRGIAISGTHGKTTVTAMIGAMLVEAGLDPAIVGGGEYAPIGGNARAGRGEWFVAEACEAYESFLDLAPEIAVITNLEPDHLDHHGTFEHLRQSFEQFLSQVQPGGVIVLCADQPELRMLKLPADRKVLWYGTADEAEVRGTGLRASGPTSECQLSVGGVAAGTLQLATPGEHNLLNALGAIAAAQAAGAPLAACLHALASFTGVGRRFEVLGTAAGLTIVDDYAHHPTEIAASIAAARRAFPDRRLVAIFQPHLYSRTRDFAEAFAASLTAADVIAVVDIYPAREAPLPGVTAALIAEPLRAAKGKDAVIEVAKDEIMTMLPPLLQMGDVVLVMGAGDIGQQAHQLAEAFAQGSVRPGI